VEWSSSACRANRAGCSAIHESSGYA